MIGLVMRMALGDSMGMCGMILGPLIAVAAICGIYQCCTCRMRDCRCIKRLLRCTGVDTFDDFEMMILVHQVTFTASSKVDTYVKVKAGEHLVHTDPDPGGLFQQALCVFVEQGTEQVKFELLNTSDKVLAELKFDVMKDILKTVKGQTEPTKVIEKMFVMKQKNKHVLNPRIKLTFQQEGENNESKALLDGIAASSATEWVLKQHIAKVTEETEKNPTQGEQGSEISLLAKGCFGPLEQFGSWGAKHAIYVGVIGPPRRKKFSLHIWDSERDYQQDKQPKDCIELLKVTGIAPDPKRADVFLINYLNQDKQKTQAIFNRIDRGRDVWVEMLNILITKIHENYKEKKRGK
mmetsp:Transcript_14172/g.27532  ORF Transcript_14172/g.27532 Transcript_14172/m.27532 type:complete len:350 (+) Transcript_14172:93-1142(+)